MHKLHDFKVFAKMPVNAVFSTLTHANYTFECIDKSRNKILMQIICSNIFGVYFQIEQNNAIFFHYFWNSQREI